MPRTQQRRFTAHLLDGRVVRCVSVEQDDTGGLWVWTTAAERIPSASVHRLDHAPPAETPTAAALDAFLDGLPKAAVSLDDYRARRTSPVLLA